MILKLMIYVWLSLWLAPCFQSYLQIGKLKSAEVSILKEIGFLKASLEKSNSSINELQGEKHDLTMKVY